MPGGLMGSGSRGGVMGMDDVEAGTIVTADLANDAVTNAKIRNSVAVSVIGRASNSTGDPADIAAAADNTFLGRQSNALAFSALTVANITHTTAGRIPYSDGSTLTSSAELTYTTATATLDVAKSLSGSTAVASIRNTSNTASSGAQLLAEVAGTSAGNPSVKLSIAGTKTYDWRIDNASSDRFDLYFDSTRIASFKDTGILAGFYTALEERVEIENTNAGLYTRLRQKASSRVLEIYTFGATFASNLFFGLTGANSCSINTDAVSLSLGTTGASSIVVIGTNNTERSRWDGLGNFVHGTAAIATNATDGFLYIPMCAGTPTGTPTAFSGRGPLVIDSTNHKLYFYDGTWRDAGP